MTTQMKTPEQIAIRPLVGIESRLEDLGITITSDVETATRRGLITAIESDRAQVAAFADDPDSGEAVYVHDSVYDDTPEHAVFGADTFGIVDEAEGGVVMYIHKENAERARLGWILAGDALS